MWIFIERVGDLYVGVAHDEDGRQLLEITEAVAESELYAQMAALSDGDSNDITCALREADERPDDGRTPERRFFHLLRVRAIAGLASQSDAVWVVSQLRNPDSIHGTLLLLWTLGYMGPEYEQVVASFLNNANTNGDVEIAIRALFRMGLLEKYADLFVEWMHGSRPPEYHGRGNASYAMAVHAFALSQNPKILRALIDASNDVEEKWTTRQHARHCLALAIDLDNAPIGLRMPADDPYFASVLEKAEILLARLTATERGER